MKGEEGKRVKRNFEIRIADFGIKSNSGVRLRLVPERGSAALDNLFKSALRNPKFFDQFAQRASMMIWALRRNSALQASGDSSRSSLREARKTRVIKPSFFSLSRSL